MDWSECSLFVLGISKEHLVLINQTWSLLEAVVPEGWHLFLHHYTALKYVSLLEKEI